MAKNGKRVAKTPKPRLRGASATSKTSAEKAATRQTKRRLSKRGATGHG